MTIARSVCAALSVLSLAQFTNAGLMLDQQPVDDGNIQFSGALGFETVTDESTLRFSRSGNNNVRNAVLEFSLAMLPSDATITGAVFQFETAGLLSNVGGAPAPVEAFVFAGDGSVTDDDHQNLTEGLAAGSIELPTGSATPIGSFIELTLDPSVIQSVVNDGASFLTLRLQTQNFATVSLRSLETDEPKGVLPTLLLAYIPAPGAFGLAGVALLTARRRR
ncbi:MAG: hypothetical protein AAGD00_01640 [Planctomycetota bacterium]